MAIHETYSERQKRLRGEAVEVFTYDNIPQPLRVQIIKIWESFFGKPVIPTATMSISNQAYEILHDTIATEVGVFKLVSNISDKRKALNAYFVGVNETEQLLHVIEAAFSVMALLESSTARESFSGYGSTKDAICELNTRFLQHGIGYEIVEAPKPYLIRKDNEQLHTEVVLPALQLLREQEFKGADDEYRSAHEHYRHERYKDCLTHCLKAFESTMKTICNKRGWAHKETDTAKPLIAVCLNNGLLGTFMQSHLTTIQAALESAIPTVRNKLGGHGQGEEVKEAPRFYAEYLLHETATTILLLVQAHKALPPLAKSARK